MPSPVERQPFINRLKADVEKIPVGNADVNALRGFAKTAFGEQAGDVKFLQDAASEADLQKLLDKANLEGLALKDIEKVIQEVRHHISVETRFDARRAHEDERTATWSPISHMILNAKEGATLFGGGLANDARELEQGVITKPEVVKALLASAIELGIKRRRIENYRALSGDGFKESLDALKSGAEFAHNLLDKESAVGKKYDAGLDDIVKKIDIEVGPGKMFAVKDEDGTVHEFEVPDQATEAAIRHHLKSVLRTDIITLVESEQLSVLSSEQYKAAHPQTNYEKFVQLRKAVSGSGTFWGVTTRGVGRVVLGGAVTAAGLSGGTAIVGGMFVGALVGGYAARKRESKNAEERLKRRKLEAALGAVDNELAIPASELNKALTDAVKTLNSAITLDAKKAGIKQVFSAASAAQLRLKQGRSDQQDYISFGIENRFQAQNQLIDNIGKSLAAYTTAMERLSPADQEALHSEFIIINGDQSAAIQKAKATFLENIATDESKRLKRATLVGAFAGGLGSLAGHYLAEWMHGGHPAVAAPEAPSAAVGTPPHVELTPPVPPVEPPPLPVAPGLNFSEQIFADPKVAKMLDAMGLQKKDLIYHSDTKLFEIPNSALHDASGKAEYLGQTAGWRARRMEFILKAMSEGKRSDESAEMIVARAERATANLLLTKGSLHDNFQAAYDEAFITKDAGFIQKNVLPWVDGTRSHVSSRWMHVVAEMKQSHPTGMPAAAEHAVGVPRVGEGVAPAAGLPVTPGEVAVAHGASAAAESYQDFLIDERTQVVTMAVLAAMGVVIDSYAARVDHVAHTPKPEDRNQYSGDDDHQVPETPLQHPTDFATEAKAAAAIAAAAEATRLAREKAPAIIVKINKFIKDADLAIRGKAATPEAVQTIKDELGKGKNLLQEEDAGVKYLDIDSGSNDNKLQKWIVAQEKAIEAAEVGSVKGEMNAFITDANTTIGAKSTVLETIRTKLLTESLTADHITALVAAAGSFVEIRAKVDEGKAVLAKVDGTVKFLDVDTANNDNKLQKWITAQEAILKLDEVVKQKVQEKIAGLHAVITATRQDVADKAPKTRLGELTTHLSNLKFVDSLASLGPVIKDATWQTEMEEKGKAAKTEAEGAIAMITLTERINEDPDVEREIKDYLEKKGCFDATNPTLPKADKAHFIIKLVEKMKPFKKGQTGLKDMGFMTTVGGISFKAEHKTRITEVLDSLFAGQDDIFAKKPKP